MNQSIQNFIKKDCNKCKLNGMFLKKLNRKTVNLLEKIKKIRERKKKKRK